MRFQKLLHGGFVGVDVFFVISGFLISSIILNGLQLGTFRFVDFYKRRIRRIFPALVIVLSACLIFGWIALLPDEYRQLGKHTAAGAGFLSNIVLLRESGYFDTAVDRKPLLHLWSLGIEEQFYVVWPPCLVLLWRRTKNVLLSVGILAFVSFALNLSLMRHANVSFYLPFTRFWELLLGCILVCAAQIKSGPAVAFVSRSSIDVRSGLRNLYAVTGAVLIGAAILLLNADRRFPGWWALLPTVGTALLILAGPNAWLNRNVLSNPRLVFVGLISYPLYLWHWPLLSFASIVTTPSHTLKLALITVSVVLAWMTWKYVEGNVRRHLIRRDIALLTASLSLAGLLGCIVFSTDGIVGRPMSNAVLRDISLRFKGTACSVGPRDLSFCVQSRLGTIDAVVVGDSHAESLIPGLATEDKQRNWLAVGQYGCPPVLGVIAEGSDGIACADKMKRVFGYLTSPGAPRLVVLAFFGYYTEMTDFAADDVQDGDGPSHFRLETDQPHESKETALIRGLENAIGLLIIQNKSVVLVVDVPELPFFPRDCIKRPVIKQTKCYVGEGRDRSKAAKGLRRIVRRLAQGISSDQNFRSTPNTMW